MLPRKKLDIGWRDLGYGLLRCVLPAKYADVSGTVEREWRLSALDCARDGVSAFACLSVRSGFDLLLQTLAFPAGSEIIVSAITILDMVHIIHSHGLVAVPVPVDTQTLSVSAADLEQALSPRTKAILVAHLFGSRMPMEAIVACARQHQLLVFEDCAQAYTGPDYRGHDGSDVAMFSFGSIKTATALGGALFSVKNADLSQRLRGAQEKYPLQTNVTFAKKILKYALLKWLSQEWIYNGFVRACRAFGKNHDAVVSQATRGFADADLMRSLRQRPAPALLALLLRRLRKFDTTQLRERQDVGARASALLLNEMRIGAQAQAHSHWVFPVLSRDPDVLVAALWEQGFDASRGASSLYAQCSAQTDASVRMMSHIVYLPVYPGVSERRIKSMLEIVQRHEQGLNDS